MTLETGSEMNHSFHFRAMNTDINVTIWCSKEDASRFHHLASDWFRYVEERFSRFQPKSELSHLNRLAGETCLVSDTMLEVLLLADSYRQLTDGIFNPLIYQALIQSGYHDTFDEIKNGTQQPAANSSPLPDQELPQPIIIRPAMKSVLLSPQSGIDLGGIVKGWAVKRLANHFKDTLEVNRGLINAGGDLIVWGGAAETSIPWLVDIEHPWSEADTWGQLALSEGSAATSSKLGRQWHTAQGPKHHLIDPRTLQPSESDVVQCTVSGGKDSDPVACEIWAKVICIVGREKGLAMLARKAVPYEALIFTAEKEVCYYGNKASIGSTWCNVSIDHYHYYDLSTEYLRYRGGEFL